MFPGKAVANTTVIVRVMDVNDNFPVFRQPSYNVTLPVAVDALTNATNWTEIYVVMATDEDSGPCGHIFYNIVSGNEAGLFRVDRTSGIYTGRLFIGLFISIAYFNG